MTSVITLTHKTEEDRRNSDFRCLKPEEQGGGDDLRARSEASSRHPTCSHSVKHVNLAYVCPPVPVWAPCVHVIAQQLAQRHVVLSARCPTFVLLYALNHSATCIITLAALICLFPSVKPGEDRSLLQSVAVSKCWICSRGGAFFFFLFKVLEA